LDADAEQTRREPPMETSRRNHDRSLRATREGNPIGSHVFTF
jgi:hypothetical protein